MMDCIDDLYIEEEIFGEEHGHSHKEHEEYDESCDGHRRSMQLKL